MNLTTKYSLGDKVFAVRHNCHQHIVRCNACNSTGSIQIQDESFVCPKCDGEAKHPVWAGEKYYIYDDGEVGKVSYAVTQGKWTNSNSNYEFADGSYKDEVEIRYMLDCSGVGSGSLWEETDLFPTRKEAQAFCDMKNSALKLDEE